MVGLQQCPKCGGNVWLEDREEYHCFCCGYVKYKDWDIEKIKKRRVYVIKEKAIRWR